MSIDRSLRIRGALTRHRNVLSRAERVMRLKDEEKWADEESVLGLPKVAHRKSHAGRKPAKETAGEAGAAGAVPEGGAAATPVAGAKPGAGAKPAAGAKAAPGAKPATGAVAKPVAEGKKAAGEGKKK